MTLPQIGTTDGAQAANQVGVGTTDANGNLSIVGPSGIQGSTITCVVTVPLAPDSATFTAILGTPSGQGTIVDTWGGNSTAGQFQIGVGQTLVVSGTNLSATTPYAATFGMITDVGDVQVVIPEPNSSALLASQGIGSTLVNLPAAPPVSGNITIVGLAVPALTRTLVISISDSGIAGVTNVSVIGQTTRFPYYNDPPYLENATSYLVVVPYIALADPTVSIMITCADTCAVKIFADTALYDESVYYNGAALSGGVAETANGTYTVVTGPARLLTASLVQAPGGSSTLGISGGLILRSDNGAAFPEVSQSVAFPPNTILKTGEVLQVTLFGGAVSTEAGVVYAYP